MNYPVKNSQDNIKPLLPSLLHTPIIKLGINLMGKVTEQTYNVMAELLNKDLSFNSQKAIVSDLSDFCSWFFDMNGESVSPERLIERDIIDYRNSCQTKGQKVNTINRKIVTLRSFCKNAIEKGFIQKNVAEKVKLLTQQPLAPKRLSKNDFRRFMREVELAGDLRNRLIVEFLAGVGLRVSELANMKVSDIVISERKGTATIRHGKGNKTRVVPLNPKIRELLKAYLEKYQPKDFLLIGQRGSIKALAINHIIGVYAEKAKVQVWPHLLRHHFAYNYLSHHQDDIVGLAQILGHSSLNTSNLYVQHTIDDLQQRVEVMVY